MIAGALAGGGVTISSNLADLKKPINKIRQLTTALISSAKTLRWSRENVQIT